MIELVFLLEELSAKAMLEGLVPRLVPPEVPVRYVPFEGKQDLEKGVARRIRGYCNPQARFLVLRDLDAAPDCGAVKRRVLSLCGSAGEKAVVVRLACRELESFYLADLAAVEAGLEIPGLGKLQGKKKYRDPDKLGSPARLLCELTAGRYQKVGGSRAIGRRLDPDNTRSDSFRNLVAAIRRLAGADARPAG